MKQNKLFVIYIIVLVLLVSSSYGYVLTENRAGSTTAEWGHTSGVLRWFGQTFQQPYGQKLVQNITLNLTTDQGATNDYWLRIETVSGGLPTGNLVSPNAVSTKKSPPTTPFQATKFVFPTPFSISANTTYAIVMKNNETLDAHAIEFRINIPSSYANGNMVYNYNEAGWNEQSTWDLFFVMEGIDGVATPPTLTLTYYTVSPLNGSNIASNTLSSFTLAGVNGTANCNLVANGVSYYANYTGLQNETQSITITTSYFGQGWGNLTVNCSDNSHRVNQTKWFFFDTLTPKIYPHSPRYNNLTQNYSIISRIYPDLMWVNITTNDTNNYAFNFTITRPISKTLYYSNFSVNVTSPLFKFERYINVSLWTSGYYLFNVTSADAHTGTILDFGTTLKDKPIDNKDVIGKMFDDSVITYASKNYVTKFDIIQEFDRKKFDITFQDGIDQFDINVEAQSNLVYVGKKYGYQAHFIIDNNYWYDLENSEGVKVVSVTKISDLNYKITLRKKAETKKVIFSSIGIINKNNKYWWAYINNYNQTQLYNKTTFNNGLKNVNVSISTPTGDQYFNALTYINVPRNANISEFYFSVSQGKTYSITYGSWLNRARELLVDVGNTGTRQINYSGFGAGYVTINNTAKLLQNLSRDCNCRSCSISTDGNCTIPINISSFRPTPYTSATLNLNNLYINFNLNSPIVDCSVSGSKPILVFNFLNETNRQRINANGVAIINFTIPSLNYKNTVIVNKTNVANLTICAVNITNTIEFDFYAQYDKYYTERYYIYDGTITNNVTKYYNLYVVTDATASIDKKTVLDSTYNFLPDITVQMQRYYPEINQWVLVQMYKSDSNGNVYFYVTEETVDYRFVALDRNTVLITTLPGSFVCTSGICTESLYTGVDVNTQYLPSTLGTITYNENTGVFRYEFNDPSAQTSQIFMKVFSQPYTRNVLICEQYAAGSSGIIYCNTSQYMNVDKIAYGYHHSINISEASIYIAAFNNTVNTILNNVHPKEGMTLSSLFLIACLMVGIFSMELGLVMLFLGFLVLGLFGFLNLGTFLFAFAVVIIVVIVYFNKKQQ